MDARRRPSGSPACPASQMKRVARTLAEQPARHADLVHGRHPAHQRQQQHPRLLHPAAGARQYRACRAAAPTSSAAMTTSRAPPIWACSPTRLPGYYGLAAGSWKHWAPRLGRRLRLAQGPLRHDQGQGRQGQDPDERGGIPVSRWIDGVLEAKDNIDQPDNLQGDGVLGPRAELPDARLPEMQKAMDKLDLLVVVDPYPTMSAVMHNRKDGVYLLPASTQFETYGSVTASNRSLQWREKVVEPLFESQARPRRSCTCSPRSSASPTRCSSTSRSNGKASRSVEDITREFNRGMWTIGYTGQSPERLKAHAEPVHFRPDHAARQGRSVRRRLSMACRGRAGARRR